MSLFQSFSDDVAAFIASIPEVKKQDVIVSVEEGSFRLRIFLALLGLNIMKAEVETLKQTGDFATISEKRSNIIENWFKRTKNNSHLEYEIRPNGEDGITVNYKTSFKRSVDVWVQSEMYLYGLITDVGGDSKPNIHIKIEQGKSYTVSCKREDIEKEKENKVYHPNGIRVIAKQNLYTGEIKDASFIEFVQYNPSYSEEDLLATIEKGQNAWSDVDNHVEWIRNLRTDD